VKLALLALCACSSHAASTQLDVTVVDSVTNAPIAARVLLFDAAGNQLHIGTIDLYGQRQGATACEFAPGVIGTWDGIVLATGHAIVPVGSDLCSPTPAIPYGTYKVWAWRGLEYERWEGQVELGAGRGTVALKIPLERAWTPRGALAADLHVHAHASNDSGMPDTQRVAAQAAAGIQVIGLSNHNTSGDASAAIRALGLEAVIWSIPSNEITSEMMHAGIYPATGPAPPADKVVTADPKTLLAMLRALPDHPIIQINHPRFRYQSLFDTTHWDGTSWPPPFPTDFDAMEVVAGYAAFNAPGDRRLDDALRDFYTLVDHGHPIAPTGGSDTHDFNWVLDGTARTYVFTDSRNDFISAIRARRTEATSGPFLDVAVSPKQGAPAVGPGQFVAADHGNVWVDVTVSQTRWMHVTKLSIRSGTTTQDIDVAPGRTFHYAGAVAVDGDSFIGVSAEGDDALPLELTGTYQRDKWMHAGVTPLAVISPILVDTDGDHHWKRGDADLLAR
jgi:hypothetical protein